eukprot:scaffold29835_cov234-Skeletonema_menzelii.AAC.1
MNGCCNASSGRILRFGSYVNMRTFKDAIGFWLGIIGEEGRAWVPSDHAVGYHSEYLLAGGWKQAEVKEYIRSVDLHEDPKSMTLIPLRFGLLGDEREARASSECQ